ncbi:MAG: DUF2784 domain-containing protein [Nocardioidaceae bacterium]
MYRWLAVGVIGLHFGYLAYLIAGGFVAWRWPRTIWLHLAAVVWAMLSVGLHVKCPLTWLQNQLRTLGDRPPLATNFIGTYVRGVFYPAHHETLTQVAVACVIVVSWAGLAYRRVRSRA